MSSYKYFSILHLIFNPGHRSVFIKLSSDLEFLKARLMGLSISFAIASMQHNIESSLPLTISTNTYSLDFIRIFLVLNAAPLCSADVLSRGKTSEPSSWMSKECLSQVFKRLRRLFLTPVWDEELSMSGIPGYSVS